jgi:hypothetical protein
MKNCKIIFGMFCCSAVLLAMSAPAARAQDEVEPQHTQISTEANTPVVVKQKPAKAVWLKAEVIHSDRNALIVREVGNEMDIHTFTYTGKAKNKIEPIQDAGGYQSGDRVRILWIPGSSEALDIKGRPSKPI